MRPPIPEPEMSHLIAFNQQLRQLVDAGIPLQWSTAQDSNSALFAADNASKELAFQVTQGSSLLDALRKDSSIAEDYKLSFLAWMATNRSPQAFDLLKRLELQLPITQLRWSWYFCLKLLILLAVSVLILWQLTSGAALSKLYAESSFPPGPVGKIAIYIHEHFWSPIHSAPKYLTILALFVVTASIYFIFRTRKPNRESALLDRENQKLLLRSRFNNMLLQSGVPIQDALILRNLLNHEPFENKIDQEPHLESNQPFQTTDFMKLHAAQWGQEQKLNRALSKSSLQRPYLIYVSVGGVIVLLLAVMVFIPVFEFIYSVEQHKGL